MKTDITKFGFKVFMLLNSRIKQLEFGSNFNGVCECIIKFEGIYIITDISEALRDLSCIIMLSNVIPFVDCDTWSVFVYTLTYYKRLCDAFRNYIDIIAVSVSLFLHSSFSERRMSVMVFYNLKRDKI